MIINYCTDCGAKLTKINDVEYTCKNGHGYYNNARAATALIFIKDGKILFAKRGHEPSKGMYDLPGGFTDRGESAETTAKREAKEELGITIKSLRYIGSAPNEYENDTHVCDILFLVTSWEGEMAAQDDVAALEWKDLNFIASPEFAATQYAKLLPELRKLTAGQ